MSPMSAILIKTEESREIKFGAPSGIMVFVVFYISQGDARFKFMFQAFPLNMLQVKRVPELKDFLKKSRHTCSPCSYLGKLHFCVHIELYENRKVSSHLLLCKISHLLRGHLPYLGARFGGKREKLIMKIITLNFSFFLSFPEEKNLVQFSFHHLKV